MEFFFDAVAAEFKDISSIKEFVQTTIRLLVAGALGGAMGYQRERTGKAAGLRTHVLVAMGTAFLVLVPRLAGMTDEAISRVIQGILTGMGFIGAGTIIKHSDERHIEGLTTSAGIWFTVAIGIAAGLGRELSAILATVMALIVLAFLPHLVGKTKASKTKKAVPFSGDCLEN